MTYKTWKKKFVTSACVCVFSAVPEKLCRQVRSLQPSISLLSGTADGTLHSAFELFHAFY